MAAAATAPVKFVPTKPRGPVAAIYTSPGPCYGLPNLTGVNSHDPRSVHNRKPAFSFGIKHGKMSSECSPGPCYLPDSKMSRNGRDGAPEFTLHSRSREATIYKTPGPGTYKPESAGLASKYNHPSFTFGSRPKYRRQDTTPAANSYVLPSMTGNTVQSGKTQAPQFSFRGRPRTGGFAEDVCKTPGPGAYSSTDPSTVKSRGPLFSMAGRNKLPGDNTKKPGPGAHSPESYWLHKKKNPKFSFGMRHMLSTAPFDAECTTDHGIVPDMTSCKRFILCINGRVVRRSKCSTGLLYDIDIGACNYEENVYCGTRSTQEPQCNNQECNIYNANVTIRVENTVVEPNFKLETTLTAPRQSLYNYLLMAAGKDNRFRFKTRPVETFGEFVTSFNGLEGTPETFSGWVSSTRRNNGIKSGIHGVFPEDKEIITFKFYSFLQNLNPQTNIPNINNLK